MTRRKKPGKQLVPVTRTASSTGVPDPLLDDVRHLIRQAREATAQAVNSALALLYWQIGQRIRSEVLKEKRAGYGEEIYSTLSNKFYLTELPPRPVLEKKLHDTLLLARARLESPAAASTGSIAVPARTRRGQKSKSGGK